MSAPVITHILFPVDFSPACLNIATDVKALARRHRARLTLLSVRTARREGFVLSHPNLPDSLEQGFDEGLGELCTESLVETGDPVEAITRFVHINGVDLVMLPTYGQARFKGSSLGSVCAGVLNGTLCPVWTAEHKECQSARGDGKDKDIVYKTVLCAVDGTPKSTPAMEWASRFSHDWGAELRLVHVIPKAKPAPGEPYDISVGALTKRASKAIEGLQRTVGVRVPVSITVGDLDAEIRSEAQRLEADSLVIGRGLLDGTRGRLGVNSRAIIQRAPCPVVSV